MTLTTNIRGRIVPTPQLVEEFEAATLDDLTADSYAGGVSLSTTGPKFGAKCALLNASGGGGFSLQWVDTQFPITATKYQLGLWVRVDTPPSQSIGPVPVVALTGSSTSVFLNALGAGTWQYNPPAAGSAWAFTPATWRYVEIRGEYDAAATQWRTDTRLHGVDQIVGALGSSGASPMDVLGFGISHPSVATNLVMAVDRLWFWAGTDADPQPDWWSSVDGWDGGVVLEEISASLQPGFHGKLAT
jgi:hypothetical protein